MLLFNHLKIGLNLCGISYGVRGRDWRRDYENIKQNILDIANPAVYVTTYNNETDQQLLETYQPTKYQFLKFEGSDLRLTYRKSLELLLDQDLDLIITTRFDMLFNQSLAHYNIDPTKFNFFFKEKGWWEAHKYTADPQYFSVFPKKFIQPLIYCVQNMYDFPHNPHCPDLHHTYARLSPIIGENNIHFIYDVETLSHDNVYVHIDRIA